MIPLARVADPDVQFNFDQIAQKFPLQLQDLATGIVLELNVTGTARKVAFGSSSVTWAAATISGQTTVAHGLGSTPVTVIAFGKNPVNVYTVFSESAAADSTNFYIKGYVASGVAVSASQNFYWLAIA